MHGAQRQLEQKLSEPPNYHQIDTASSHLQHVVTAELPTHCGQFTIHGFYDPLCKEEHSVLVRGKVQGQARCPLRLHSECHTGDTLGSLRCDCQQQLRAALRYIGHRSYGVLIYLRQEGRGIGLINKLKAYHLQDRGLDTIEANQYLGFHADQRDYRVAIEIIKWLKIQSIMLMSNNPHKFEELQRAGIEISGRIKLKVRKNRHNRSYLNIKRSKMHHLG